MAERLENPLIRLFCIGKHIKEAILHPALEREAQAPSCPPGCVQGPPGSLGLVLTFPQHSHQSSQLAAHLVPDSFAWNTGKFVFLACLLMSVDKEEIVIDIKDRKGF